jgi:MFS family permease
MENHTKLIRYYILVKSLESASIGWLLSTYVLFLLDMGLTEAQTTQVNTTFMVTNFFIDLPTGAIADIVGQFPIYILGLLVYGSGHFLYGLGTNIIQFHLSESTAAIGTSMMSEALEALLTNEIGIDRAKEVMSREGVFARIAMIPTSLLGSMIAARFGLQYPWFLGGLTALICAIVGYITLRKYHYKEKHRNGKKILENLKEIAKTVIDGTGIVFSKKQTRLVIFVSGMTALATQAANMFWAPVMAEISNEGWWLGFFWTGISLSSLLGSILSKKITAKPIIIGLIVISIGLPLALTPIYAKNGLWVGSMFLLHEVGRGALPIILYAYMNKFIPNDKRSTSNSARGSIERIFRIVGLSMAGFLSTRINLLQTWLVSGVLLIIVGIVVLIRKER